MIITEIKGGIGNQMFQYAFGRCLSEINSTELKLNIDFFGSIREGVTPRNYLLNNFCIREQFATKEEINTLRKKSFVDLLLPSKKKFLKDKNNKCHSTFFKKQTDRYLSGYWQSEDFFKPIEKIIREEFKIKNIPNNDKINEISEKIKSTNSVSIHFRKTDYVGKSIGEVCSVAYYTNSIEKIKSIFGEDICLFIFSDDIEWVKNTFNYTFPHIFVEGVADIENCINDLYLMSLCKNNIIANSSFSWWAAWLNENPEKVVIAPSVWDPNNERHGIIPKSWLKVSV